ncbi:MAG: DUF5605 domain-containing protein [Clostridiales bacterium]|nr:DUF5605 domain-containing protein [Clostridiales bacterium]
MTHVSYQTKALHHVADWYRQYQKPVLVDECCYEGNLPYLWGCISGKEMVSRFWKAVMAGGYCTHGEAFLDPDNEVVWWAKGGHLIGESPERIAFLKEFVYSLPGAIEPTDGDDPLAPLKKVTPEAFEEMRSRIPESSIGFTQSFVWMNEVEREYMFAGEHIARGKVDDRVYLVYLGDFCPAQFSVVLPKEHTYRVEMIDTWEMTRTTVLEGVNGDVMIPMPGKPNMAIAAFAEED